MFMREYEILDVHAIEILDAQAIPTLEVTITLKDGITGKAAVPSGSFGNPHEAYELRDGDKRHLGKGVEQAVTNVNTRIADKLIGMNVLDQVKIDRLLIEADGTENKRKYGANAIFGVSLACGRAAANALGIPLYQYIGGFNAKVLPVPRVTVMSGKDHRFVGAGVPEIMISPVGAYNFSHGMEMICEVYHYLKMIQENSNCADGNGDVFSQLQTTTEALSFLVEAVEQAGYRPGHDIVVAINVAADTFYDENSELYYFKKESMVSGKEVFRNAEEMVQYYEELVSKYPVGSIEDGLAAGDKKGWKLLSYRLGERIQLVGDELFASNYNCLKEGVKDVIANALLIKPNQVGTLTETLDVIEYAKKVGYDTIISCRCGDTEDSFIADLAVAMNVGEIKTGAPCRGECTAKYNRLLKIEEELGKNSIYRVK